MATSHNAVVGASVDFVKIKRAVLSVSDKTGLVEFARALHAHGVELLSTGGTASALKSAGIPVSEVSSATGFPEILHGRVKTLHPFIHGGLLAVRGNTDDEKDVQTHKIPLIDLIVVNLYPFESTVAAQGEDFAKCVENIDIGGPAMIRSASKNHQYVSVVTQAAQYDRVLAELKSHDGAVSYTLRRALAAEAFAMTSKYDTAIAAYFQSKLGK